MKNSPGRLFSGLLILCMSLSLIACEVSPQTDPQTNLLATSTPGAAIDSPASNQADLAVLGDQVVQALEALKTSLNSFDTLSDLDPPSE
jgi:hypothetical protein